MRPDLDHYMMALAEVAATRTTCIKRGVGCVLADAAGHVLSIGYNGVASGMPHCNEFHQVPVYHDDVRVWHNKGAGTWEFKGKETACFRPEFFEGAGNKQCVGFDEVATHACKGHSLPSGQDSCEAVHAETNAMLQCRDVSLIATAYVTLSPCKPCLKLLINTGCRRIVFKALHDDPWPGMQWEKLGRFWELLGWL